MAQIPEEMHDLSVRLLTEKLIDLKVLRGTLGHHLQLRSYAKYYPHSIGHPTRGSLESEGTLAPEGSCRPAPCFAAIGSQLSC